MSAGVTITAMGERHADAVLEIYRLGIATGNATFETEPPTWDGFITSRMPGHRWIAVDPAGIDPAAVDAVGIDPAGRVVGWTACSAVSDRCVYAGVVEHSVYVHPEASGRGVGRALLNALIASTEQAGIWTIQSGVFPENTASLALHAACGFRVIGTRQRIGRHHGTWRDVTLIERRSPAIT